MKRGLHLTYTPEQVDAIRRQAGAYAYALSRHDEYYARGLLLPAAIELPASEDFEAAAMARCVNVEKFPQLWDEMVAAMNTTPSTLISEGIPS